MSLDEIHIHRLRNIDFEQIHLHPRYNVFFGKNGAGKTTLLEAIYLLSTGYSFRTRETAPLIAHEQQDLVVFARTNNRDEVSIQKIRHGATHVRLNRKACATSSELAFFLPCLAIYQDLFQIIDAGPAVRRALLDWGVFHVKQSYLPLWKDYQRVIKQRNALLRQRAPKSQFTPWNQQLVMLAQQLDLLREQYCREWTVSFEYYLGELSDLSCHLDYYKGWDKKKTGKELMDILEQQFESDCIRQYTQSGAHQADLIFDVRGGAARQTLSRGQQKILLIALRLAQAALLNKECIYLFDDISAELDSHVLSNLLSCIQRHHQGQFIMTTLDSQLFEHPDLTEGFFATIVDGLVTMR